MDYFGYILNKGNDPLIIGLRTFDRADKVGINKLVLINTGFDIALTRLKLYSYLRINYVIIVP